MADELNPIDTEIVDDTQKYLDTINELKKNTVSREEYNKLRDENKTLLNTIVNGGSLEQDAAAPQKPTIQELRDKLYGKNCEDLTDLEYIEATLDLRDALLEETGTDYFAPTGSQYTADFNDQKAAQETYEALRHCVEVADGDNQVFIQEITRLIPNDSGITKIKRRK